jgi:hypothetical protein
MSWKREGARIVIEIDGDTFDALMMCLGLAAAHPEFCNIALCVANTVNEGNPHYRPYAITQPEPERVQ